MDKSIKTTSSFGSLLFQIKRAYNEIVEVKRLILLIALIVILPVLVVSDTSLTDSSIPDNEVTASQTEASNSSASATITITWTTASPSDE